MKLHALAGGITLAGAFAAGALAPAAATPFVGSPAAAQPLTLLIKLPLRNETELEALARVQSDPASPQYRHFITRAQFRARFAPAADTVARAVAVLNAGGLTVREIHSQLIVVRAPAAAVERALHVPLALARDADGRTRIVARALPAVPPALDALHASIVGLAGIERPRPQVRRVSRAAPQNRDGSTGPYFFTDLKQAYSYPAYKPFNGAGVTIAVVGEADSSDSDALQYFNGERLGGTTAIAPAPPLEHLQLGGAPFEPNDPTYGTDSVEADVDVEQSGGSAPGATIITVDVPSDQGNGEGFLYGYSYLEENNLADIISTSYGECERFYTRAYNGGVDETGVLRAYHELFVQGNVQGITFVFSSGDDSGTPCPEPGYFGLPANRVFKDLPGTSIWSSDPNVTSVGGTNLVTSAQQNLDSAYISENAYRDTFGTFDPFGHGNLISNAAWGSGGGPSVIFAKPWYQYVIDTGSSKMRTDPDVAMQMGGCPEYGVSHQCGPDDSSASAVIAGADGQVIGTSLSAPEFAGLLAVYSQSVGTRLGNVNGYIYESARTNSVDARPIFHQGIPGDNGIVAVKRGQRGYNPIIGVGTPYGNAFARLERLPAAGDPQTAGNP